MRWAWWWWRGSPRSKWMDHRLWGTFLCCTRDPCSLRGNKSKKIRNLLRVWKNKELSLTVVTNAGCRVLFVPQLVRICAYYWVVGLVQHAGCLTHAMAVAIAFRCKWTELGDNLAPALFMNMHGVLYLLLSQAYPSNPSKHSQVPCSCNENVLVSFRCTGKSWHEKESFTVFRLQCPKLEHSALAWAVSTALALSAHALPNGQLSIWKNDKVVLWVHLIYARQLLLSYVASNLEQLCKARHIYTHFQCYISLFWSNRLDTQHCTSRKCQGRWTVSRDNSLRPLCLFNQNLSV